MRAHHFTQGWSGVSRWSLEFLSQVKDIAEEAGRAPRTASQLRIDRYDGGALHAALELAISEEDSIGGGGSVVEDSHALHRVSSWPVKGSQLGLMVV